MYVTLLNASFEKIYVLDDFKSLLWTERYWESGDSDITCTPTDDILIALSDTRYLDLGGVDRSERQLMEIETLRITTNPIEGNEIVIKAHTLDRKLNSRIVWYETLLNTDLENAVDILIVDAVICDTDRQLVNFVYAFSDISCIYVFSYFWGEFVYDAIAELCKTAGIGFYVLLNEQENNRLEFYLREGVDRSHTQDVNRVVAFNTKLNNLLNAGYVQSIVPYRNVCLVIGQPKEDETVPVVQVGTATGVDRREIFLKPNIAQGDLTDPEYLELLYEKGKEELAKHPYLKAFEGEVAYDSYVYGKDYTIGDILSLEDDYGHAGRSRIVEMIFFQDPSGTKIYPTFEAVEDEPVEEPPE